MFDSSILDHFPQEPGVYLMKDPKGKILYIGKALCLRKRLKQYFGHDNRPTIPFLLKELHTIDTVVVPSEKEALLLENTLIKQHKPKYNLLLKDDKRPVSLALDPREEWPRLRFVRTMQKKEEKGVLYFGPYAHGKDAKEVFVILCRLFPLRQCSDEELSRRSRPCILYDMKRCLAPCTHQCTQAEYRTYVEGAIAFLQGKSHEVCKDLSKQMEIAAENLEFEKAALLLQTQRKIEEITHSASAITCQHGGSSYEVLGVYRESTLLVFTLMTYQEGLLSQTRSFLWENSLESEEEACASFLLQHYEPETAPLPTLFLLSTKPEGQAVIQSILEEKHGYKSRFLYPIRGENKRIVDLAIQNAQSFLEQHKKKKLAVEQDLIALQQALDLQNFPQIIECFDTSHLTGSCPVASQAVFIAGQEEKKKHRTYHIRQGKGGDDYSSLREVLFRRFSHTEDPLPDLLLIDGGRGQLQVAIEVLHTLGIASVDIRSLVKEDARHDKGLAQDKICAPHRAHAICLPERSPLLFLLQKIRDTAHDIALRFHRKTRSRSMYASALDSIPGIGKKKKQAFLQYFGSIEHFLQTYTEKSKAPGLSCKELATLYAHLSQNR